MSKKLVTGLLRTRFAAENAVERIMSLGYAREDVSVVMSDSTRAKHFALEEGNKSTEGMGVGASVGAGVGAIVAAIAAIGTSLILPGVGLIIAGPLAAGLAGAGAGGAAGGLIGALVGSGIPEHRAKAYEAGLKMGGVLLGVEARTAEDVKELEQILNDAGAEDVRSERLASNP